MKISNDAVVKRESIGEIIYDGRSKIKMNEIRATLLNKTFEIMPFIKNPVSFQILPNGNLLCGTYGSVMQLDENLKKINDIQAAGLCLSALNDRNQIYVSSHSKHCIILFDLDLNQLNQFGSYGTENNQLNYPLGLCCKDEKLYICDYNNKRVQILTLDFEYINTLNLNGNPRRIQISNTAIGISCNQGTYFYDLKTETLKNQFDSCTYNINYIDSIFYTSNYLEKKFYFFDTNGNFIEEISINENICRHMANWPSGNIFRFKNNIYISDYDSGKLLRFI